MESQVELARQACAKFDYREALEILDRASIQYSSSPDLLAAYGSVYLKAEEPRRARQYLDRAVGLNPDCLAGVIGEAEASLIERDYSKAEEWLQRLLCRATLTSQAASRSHALLARARLETGHAVEAEAEVARSLEANGQNADALYAMAFIRASERKPNSVRALARRAIEIDPYLAGARRLLAQYLNGQRGYRQEVHGPALEHFQKGESLERMGNQGAALLEFQRAVGIQPHYFRAWIALAGLLLSEKDYKQAVVAAARAVDEDPEAAIANMQLAYAQLGLAEQARIKIGATDYSSQFYGRTEPHVKISLLRVFFPDFDGLSSNGQFVVEQSVASLACFLPILVSSNAQHRLLAFDQRVTDYPGFTDLRDRVTFDGRYYSSIRGVSGRIALSGVEYLEEAARGGFNGIAHEFAHQVQENALGAAELGAIRKLYEGAKKEGRALDYYAAANEFEYFAVGYEAFVSSFKRPGVGPTSCHTREELRTRDPGLYMLLTKLADRSAQVAMN